MSCQELQELAEPSWDRVFADLRDLVRRDYGEFGFAALTVHIRDGMPDMVIPVTPEVACAPVASPRRGSS